MSTSPAPPNGDPNENPQPPETQTPAAPPKPTDIPAKPPRQGDPDARTRADIEKLREALERERGLRKDAEKRAKEGAGYKSKLDELESAAQTETERAVTAARKETAAEVLAAANWRLVNAEARAMAAEVGFRSPTLAVKTLELADVKVTDDGVVDTDAVKAALDALAKDAPYLLADDGKPRPPKPDPSQGSGKTQSPLTGTDKGKAEAARRFGKRAAIPNS